MILYLQKKGSLLKAPSINVMVYNHVPHGELTKEKQFFLIVTILPLPGLNGIDKNRTF